MKYLYVFIGLVVVGGIVFLFVKGKNQTAAPTNADTSGIIFFYGDGCPHCANVEQYISENNVKEKVSFTELEVFNNENNASLMASLAQKCGMNTSNLGVPLLWDGSSAKCYEGDVDVINFFKDKIGTTTAATTTAATTTTATTTATTTSETQ